MMPKRMRPAPLVPFAGVEDALAPAPKANPATAAAEPFNTSRLDRLFAIFLSESEV